MIFLIAYSPNSVSSSKLSANTKSRNSIIIWKDWFCISVKRTALKCSNLSENGNREWEKNTNEKIRTQIGKMNTKVTRDYFKDHQNQIVSVHAFWGYLKFCKKRSGLIGRFLLARHKPDDVHEQNGDEEGDGCEIGHSKRPIGQAKDRKACQTADGFQGMKLNRILKAFEVSNFHLLKRQREGHVTFLQSLSFNEIILTTLGFL
jgi:hypothetical protein